MPLAKPLILWGTGNLSSFSDPSSPSTSAEDAVLNALNILKSYNVSHIDTAQRYGGGTAEATVGDALRRFQRRSTIDANTSTFVVDTKWAIDATAETEPEVIIQTARVSVANLRLAADTLPSPMAAPVETFYLHSAPHESTALTSVLAAIDTLHQQNIFVKFGLSNFTPGQIRHVHSLCMSNNFVLPTVYQGMYNAVFRVEAEKSLLPTLRDLNIAFRAYSPVAGGFLTKSRQHFEQSSATAGTGGARFAVGGLYQDTYVTPEMLDALDTWGEIADTMQGVSRAELAYRWVVWHSGLDGSLGDGVIVGAGNTKQLEQTLQAIERGRLDDDVVKAIEEVGGRLAASKQVE